MVSAKNLSAHTTRSIMKASASTSRRRSGFTNDNDEPIYFSGTDPRNASLGYPPPEDANFWSPREVWARGLATEQWYDYMGLESSEVPNC